MMLDVLCCCNPANLMGYLPESSTNLNKREADVMIERMAVTYTAFDSNELSITELRKIPGFVEAEAAPIQANRKKKPKWRK